MKSQAVLVLMALAAVVVSAVKPQKYLTTAELERREISPFSACENVDDFQCDNGRCIQPEWVCDTQNDCMDNSDEHVSGCNPNCGGMNKFNCSRSQGCIPTQLRCDGTNDCADNSDEEGCELVPCHPREFKCHNHICIEDVWVCDGTNDCKDNSDENRCETCKPGFFRCATSYHCVRNAFRCDGSNDCDDGSDEANCPVAGRSFL